MEETGTQPPAAVLPATTVQHCSGILNPEAAAVQRLPKLPIGQCYHCGKDFKNSNRDKWKLTSKLPSMPLTIGEVLKTWIFKENPQANFPLARDKYVETRYLCSSCTFKLKALEKAYQAFIPPPGTDSHVRRLLDMPSKEKTPVPPPPVPEGKVRGGAKVPKVTVKLRKPPVKFTLGHLVLLRKEIHKVGTHSKSLNYEPSVGSKVELPNWGEVDAELRELAPNVRRVLVALSGKSVHKMKEMNGRVGSALAILAFSASFRANRVQKYLSQQLSHTLAGKKLFSELNSLGISTAYRSMRRTTNSGNKNNPSVAPVEDEDVETTGCLEQSIIVEESDAEEAPLDQDECPAKKKRWGTAIRPYTKVKICTYKCKVCSRGYLTLRCMMRHVRIKHEGGNAASPVTSPALRRTHNKSIMSKRKSRK